MCASLCGARSTGHWKTAIWTEPDIGQPWPLASGLWRMASVLRPLPVWLALLWGGPPHNRRVARRLIIQAAMAGETARHMPSRLCPRRSDGISCEPAGVGEGRRAQVLAMTLPGPGVVSGRRPRGDQYRGRENKDQKTKSAPEGAPFRFFRNVVRPTSSNGRFRRLRPLRRRAGVRFPRATGRPKSALPSKRTPSAP